MDSFQQPSGDVPDVLPDLHVTLPFLGIIFKQYVWKGLVLLAINMLQRFELKAEPWRHQLFAETHYDSEWNCSIHNNLKTVAHHAINQDIVDQASGKHF